MPPIPKPTPRKTLKARQKREEATVIRRVRAACVERDGYCVLIGAPWAEPLLCDGPSELAHLHTHRRSKSRGMPTEERHAVEGCVMLCRAHHRAYDAHSHSVEKLVAQSVALRTTQRRWWQ